MTLVVLFIYLLSRNDNADIVGLLSYIIVRGRSLMLSMTGAVWSGWQNGEFKYPSHSERALETVKFQILAT